MKEVSRVVEETRQRIASGELTYDQMREKLIAAIDKEYEKEGEPNIELINACEELLAELATNGQPLPESHEDQYGEVIRQNIEVSHRAGKKVKLFPRIAAVVAMLVLVLGLAQPFLHWEWFEHDSTDDEQQYTVQGFTVDPSLIAKCIADEGSTSAMYYSDNYDEIKKHLGFDLPSEIFIKRWKPIHYFVEIQSAYVKCTVLFNNPQTNDRLTIQIGMFTNVENAYTTFEQNDKGDEEKIGRTTVYHSQNVETNTVVWLDDNCIWRCYGPIDNGQLSSVVEAILGGILDE